MSQSINVQEFAIALVTERHSPKILTPDFLKYSGIVPSTWELTRPPILTDSVSQVVFQNGVNIAAQINKIVFAELIATKEAQEVEISTIARKYIEKLPEVKYQGISLSFRGYVIFDGKNNTTRNYIFKRLFNPGPWQEYGKTPVQAAMRLTYTLEKAQLNLEINEAGLQLPDKKMVPAVMFSANFNHPLVPENQGERLAAIAQIISDWNSDREIFREVVNTKFLTLNNYHVSLAPGLPTIAPTETL